MWFSKLRANRFAGFVIAIASVALLTGARVLWMEVLGRELALLPYVLAVVVAAWVGGLWPAIAATLLSILAAVLCIMPPVGISIAVERTNDLSGILIFGLVGIAIGVITEAMHRAIIRSRNAALAHGRSEERLRLITDNLPVLISYVDHRERYQFNNAAYQRWFGQTPENLLDKPLREVLGEQAFARIEPYVKRALAGETLSFEDVLPYREGGARSIEAQYVPDFGPEGEVRGYYAVIQDTTARKQAEAKALESERRFARMADNAPVLIWISDTTKKCVYFNRPWLEFTGRSINDEIGDGWVDCVHSEDLQRCTETYENAFDRREAFSMEYRLRRRDGEYRWMLDHGIPRHDDHGTFAGYIGSCIDITERKVLEEERRVLLDSERFARAESDRASRLKDDFVATLSHELRTPINAILGWAQLLSRPSLKEQDIRQGVEVIERNARLQSQLIGDLLDISRIISGKIRLDVQSVQLKDVIEQACVSVQPSAETKQIRLQRVLDPLAGPISGDPNRLQQIMWNLLSNAIKFTPRGGRVRVVLQRVNSHVEIHVNDNGVGIDPDFLPHVFDRFRQANASTTRRFGGLGLGLAIVKHFAELHGGSASVRSAGQNQGSTFTVRLPVMSVHGAADEPSAPQRVHPGATSQPIDCESINLQNLAILVVDDEPDARNLVRRILEECRARVMLASSLDEALAILDCEHVDVLISDIGMPEKDGYDLIRAVRARPSEAARRLPAVALTAFARAEDHARALILGYQAHISKPVEASLLLATIASVAGRTANREGSAIPAPMPG